MTTPFTNFNTTLHNEVLWERNGSGNSSDGCLAVADLFPDPVHTPGIRVLFGIPYTLAWLMGILGNSVVVYVAAFKNVSLNVRSVFILSLACSDLLICTLSLPFTSVTIFTQLWLFPSFLCYLIGYVAGVAVCASSFTLCAIAIDRYFLILQPTKPWMTYFRARIIVGCIWLASISLASPIFFHTELVSIDPFVCGLFCKETWPGRTQSYYGLGVMILQFAVPLIISCLCYMAISQKLGEQIKSRRKSRTFGLPQFEQRGIKRRRRTNRMMVSMVACFVFAYFPINFANLVRDFKMFDIIIPASHFAVFFSSVHLIAMTSVCWNPLIYGWFNEPFRQIVVSIAFKLFPACEKCSRPEGLSMQAQSRPKVQCVATEGPEQALLSPDKPTSPI